MELDARSRRGRAERAPRRPGVPPAPAAMAVLVFSALAVLPAPFSWPARVATALPVVALVLVAVRRGWRRRLPAAPLLVGRGAVLGVAGWVLVVALVGTVQLTAFTSEPRELYPTLSALAADAFSAYPVRTVAFAAWVWLGWYLVDR